MQAAPLPATSVIRLLLLTWSVVVATSWGHAAGAVELTNQAHSLRVIPADTSVYVAFLKNQQQVELLQNTAAWNKFINIPLINMGINQVKAYWQFPPDERLMAVRDWIQGPDGRATVGLLADMGSEEVVFYGDQKLARVLELLMEFNSEINAAQAEVMRNMNDLESDTTEEEIVIARMQAFLEAHGDDIVVPTFVLAGRIKNNERASEVVDLLEQHLRELISMSPVPLEGNLSREQNDRLDLLTLSLTGDMLPWEEIEEEYQDNPALYNLLRKIAYDKKMVVTVGTVHDFFVLSLGESTEHFTNLPTGNLLVETAEFERLKSHSDKELTSIVYLSGPMMKTLSSNERTFRDMAVTFKGALALSDLDPLRKETIENDIDELAAELIAYIPDASTVAGVSFMTERGYESFTYSWGKLPPTVDATQKLSLIDHVGTDSIGWAINSGKQSLEGYEHFTSCLERIFVHIEAVAEHQATVDDWKRYEEVRAEVIPLLKRLDVANRTQLLPATASGQGAVVFDASATSKSWCNFMPEARRELALPTIAMVFAVDDADKLRAGVSEYFAVAQQAIDIAHRVSPEVPGIRIPIPDVTAVTGGELYAYTLPAEWGADERVAPSAALSNNVLVLSLLPEVSEKLLAQSRPDLDGPLANFDRPLVSASHFKLARFIDTLKPWIDYGVQVAIQNQQEGEVQQAVAMVGFVKPQIEQVLDVLKAIDSVTSVQYLDRDVVVLHSEMRIINRE
jgi:hypothetical protein